MTLVLVCTLFGWREPGHGDKCLPRFIFAGTWVVNKTDIRVLTFACAEVEWIPIPKGTSVIIQASVSIGKLRRRRAEIFAFICSENLKSKEGCPPSDSGDAVSEALMTWPPQWLNFGSTGGAGDFTAGAAAPPVNMLEEALVLIEESSVKIQLWCAILTAIET